MARKVQKKKTTKKTPMKKKVQKVSAIDVNEILETQINKKHTPLNLGRYDQKLSQFAKQLPYQTIARRLIADYKKKKLNASEFKFNEDVIRIIKHQVKSNQF